LGSLTTEGEPVPPDVAAERIVQLLGQTRTVDTPVERPDGTSGPKKPAVRTEPVGVVVRADLEISGLRGQPVLLAWQVWQEGGRTRLFGRWLKDSLAYRLTPTSESDSGSVQLWVPLPKEHGRYYVRLELRYKGNPLASGDSAIFD
jgi:hypothetical protein